MRRTIETRKPRGELISAISFNRLGRMRVSRLGVDLAKLSQYGPRGFKGRARFDCRARASVEVMSGNARENGNRNKAHTD